jgi:shikimate dehydrogenase
MVNQRIFGLIGHPLEHSFSPEYFKKKFEKEQIYGVNYLLLPLEKISLVKKIATEKNLSGFNVTIPFKQEIIHYLDHAEKIALEMNSVNVVKIVKGKWYGYNTDIIGFSDTIAPLLPSQKANALILGTGGSSRMVQYALRKMGVSFSIVSRNPKNSQLSYQDLTKKVLENHKVIINTTPLGMFPDIQGCPLEIMEGIGSEHLVYDLIYNPLDSTLLKRAKEKGATIQNGLSMLHIQAEKSWEIWNYEGYYY